MITPLFLDTSDGRYFSTASRQTVEEICAAADREIRSHIKGLPSDIELACQTGEFVIPETGEMGAAIAPQRVGWTVNPRFSGGVAAVARARQCHHS